MDSASLEERVARLEEQQRAMYSLLRKQANREMALRALAYAALNNVPPDHRERLPEQIDAYVLQLLEQVPPSEQDPEVLRDFVDLLRSTPRTNG